MPPLDLLGTFQDPLQLDQGAGKLVNVRVVLRSQAAEGKPAKVRFVGAPGLTPVCKPTPSPCIAISHAVGTVWSGHANGSIYYGVETATPTLSGFVAVDPAQPTIRFAEDRTALVITSNFNLVNPGGVASVGIGPFATGGTGYFARQPNPPNVVTNCGFDASINFDPSAVTELDNQALWSGASNFYSNQDAKVYRSQPLDPANVQPNSFGTKEARADRVIDLAVSGRVLWVLGSRSLEQWYNSGANTDMPFIPYPNSLVEVGLAARLSLAQLRGNIVLVATDRRIWLCAGQTGKPISPQWIDLLLQQLTFTQLASLTAYAYGQGGSDFYVLTLPGVWSVEMSSTGIWSYRQSPGRPDHAGRCATEDNGGATYVGLDTGDICLLDINNATEPGGTLSRTMITPWVGGAPAKNMMTSGTGQEETRNTVDAIDVTSSMGPQAGTFELDWSETNDVTVNGVLITPRVWRGLRQIQMPQPGERRAIGRNFGSSRRRQFRLRYGGTQAPFTIDELFAQITGGS